MTSETPQLKDDVKSRLIGFVDILGFSELVKYKDFHTQLKGYVEVIRSAIKDKSNELEYTMFSDSIVILTPGETIGDFIKLAQAMASLSYNLLIKNNLPTRGCITNGDIYHQSSINDKDVVIAGTPIVDAYNLEKKQNWLGILISPSTIRHFYNKHNIEKLSTLPWFGPDKHLSNNLSVAKKLTANQFYDLDHRELKFCVYKYEEIPIRENESYEPGLVEGFVIVPNDFSTTIDQMVKDLRNVKNQLKKLMSYTSSPASQKKYTNTIKFVEKVYDIWDELLNPINRTIKKIN